MNNQQQSQVVQIVNPIEQVVAHKAMSGRYQFVSTANLVDIFKERGWVVDSEQVARARSQDKIGYQQHLIRLSHPDFQELPGLSADNASKPQIVVLNSHDGTKALRMFFGLVRTACANGLIAGAGFKNFRAKHVGDLSQNVNDGIEYLVDNMPAFFEQISRLQQVSLSEEQMQHLTRACIDARLANVNGLLTVDYKVPVLRAADQAEDAFTQMNRIQERVIRGGIRYTQERQERDLNGNVIGTKIAHCRTRGIGSIPQQIALNQLVMNETLALVG